MANFNGPFQSNIQINLTTQGGEVEVTVGGNYRVTHHMPVTQRVAITRWVVSIIRQWRVENPWSRLLCCFSTGDGYGQTREQMGRKFGFVPWEDKPGYFYLPSLQEEGFRKEAARQMAQMEAERLARRKALEDRMSSRQRRRRPI